MIKLALSKKLIKNVKLSKLETKGNVLTDINFNTLLRISEIEKIVALTGLPLSTIKLNTEKDKTTQKHIDDYLQIKVVQIHQKFMM